MQAAHRTTRARRTAAILGAAGLTTALLTGTASARPDSGAGENPELAEARAATAAYHDIEKARAAGYPVPEVSELNPAECTPGMGYHVVNPELMTTDPAALDPTKPQALLYQLKDGALKLVAIEWVVLAPEAPVAENPDQVDPNGPELFGQNFNGVMEGHFPGMPNHWDLHAYLWSNNPNGTLAQYNPKITC